MRTDLSTKFKNMGQSPVRIFLETCFVKDGAGRITFEAVWRHWVWFAQTHPAAKPLWPYPLPSTHIALSHRIRQCWIIQTMVLTRSYKRGERHDDEETTSSYRQVVGMSLKPRNLIVFPGMNEPWYPNPWIGDSATLGRPLPSDDPIGLKVFEIRNWRGSLYQQSYEHTDQSKEAKNHRAYLIEKKYRNAMRDLVKSHTSGGILPPPDVDLL